MMAIRAKFLRTGATNMRAIERLAQKMYEANNPGDIPWVGRGWDVRKAWLSKARQRFEGAGAPVDSLYIWDKIKSLFRF